VQGLIPTPPFLRPRNRTPSRLGQRSRTRTGAFGRLDKITDAPQGRSMWTSKLSRGARHRRPQNGIRYVLLAIGGVIAALLLAVLTH
jgi:hypothetical protein